MIEGFLDQQTPKKASINKISFKGIDRNFLMIADYLPKG